VHQILFTHEVKFRKLFYFQHDPLNGLLGLLRFDSDIQFAAQHHQHAVLRIDQHIAYRQFLAPVNKHRDTPVSADFNHAKLERSLTH
jgi:hypothetical protein